MPAPLVDGVTPFAAPGGSIAISGANLDPPARSHSLTLSESGCAFTYLHPGTYPHPGSPAVPQWDDHHIVLTLPDTTTAGTDHGRVCHLQVPGAAVLTIDTAGTRSATGPELTITQTRPPRRNRRV